MILIWFFELIKTPSFSCFKINLRFINKKYDIERIVFEKPSKVFESAVAKGQLISETNFEPKNEYYYSGSSNLVGKH